MFYSIGIPGVTTALSFLCLPDTQEAPKSLSLEDSSSMESLADSSPSESQAPSPPPPPLSPPFQPPANMIRRRLLRRGENGVSGAFMNYVRARGEPDGRTAAANDQPKLRTSGVGGRESDAFTPSPVNPITKLHQSVVNIGCNFPEVTSSPKPSPKISLTLSHQNKIRNMFRVELDSHSENGGAPATRHRPDSSSSTTSSVTDWESNGQVTILRRQNNATTKANQSHKQPSSGFESQSSDSNSELGRKGLQSLQKLLDDSFKPEGDVESRLSVRTEVGKGGGVYHHPPPKRVLSHVPSSGSSSDGYQRLKGEHKSNNMKGVKNPPPPPLDTNFDLPNHAHAVYSLRSKETPGGRSQMLQPPPRSIHDHVIASQLSRRNHEVVISDVYHDRNVGLGLAPSLSKILMSSDGIASAAGDLQQEANEVNSVISKFSPNESHSTAIVEGKPMPPPKRMMLKPCPPTRSGPWFDPKMAVARKSNKARNDPPPVPGDKRDEADGRSVHEMSHSLSRINRYQPNIKKVNELADDSSRLVEDADKNGGEFCSYATTNPAYEDDVRLMKARNQTNGDYAEVIEKPVDTGTDSDKSADSNASEDFSTQSNLTVRKVKKTTSSNACVNNLQSSPC